MFKIREYTIRPVQTASRLCATPAAPLFILIGLCLLGSAPPPAVSDEMTGQREEARFDIYVDGKEIGSERFTVLTSSDGVESNSTVNFRDPGKSRKKILMETRLSMDNRFMPRSYQLRTDVEGQKGTVTGSFVPGEATFEYKGTGNPLQRGLLVGNRYIVLDTNVFHHYIFLARAYDVHAGGVQSIEAVIPQELDGGKLKVKDVGTEMVSVRGNKMTLHHLNADSGMLAIDLWVDDRQILYKIALPSKKIEVVRNR